MKLNEYVIFEIYHGREIINDPSYNISMFDYSIFDSRGVNIFDLVYDGIRYEVMSFTDSDWRLKNHVAITNRYEGEIDGSIVTRECMSSFALLLLDKQLCINDILEDL